MTDENKRRLMEAGIDVDDALARLMQNEGLFLRVLRAFLQDGNFARLQEALAKGDVSGAFTAAHTLKGVAGNLSLNALYERVSGVVECLRGGDMDAALVLMPAVQEAYDNVTLALQEGL